MLPQLYDSVACVCDLAMSINSYQNGDMGDGRGSGGGQRPVLVLVHGLAGSESVTVMASTVADVKERN
jgi:predicted alpha/beta-fold hydrolase